jgi:hypothetical protein
MSIGKNRSPPQTHLVPSNVPGLIYLGVRRLASRALLPQSLVTKTQATILAREDVQSLASANLAAALLAAHSLCIVTIVLFQLPCLPPGLGRRASASTATEGARHSWRMSRTQAALTIASCATRLELVFFFSWLHNGGSPHGRMPSSGVCKIFGTIATGTLVASVLWGAFGKGKPRLPILSWGWPLLLLSTLS